MRKEILFNSLADDLVSAAGQSAQSALGQVASEAALGFALAGRTPRRAGSPHPTITTTYFTMDGWIAM